jgi:predicted AlkP superfamily pyrophosphatase or phosphodiesterase
MMKLAGLCAVMLASLIPVTATAADDEPPSRLVVLVVVDGLSPGVVDRVDDLFVGGLARLYAEGVVFSDCHQDHAHTWTGPGHFVLGSGRFPGPAGIIENRFYDPAKKKRIYCIGDPLAAGVGDSRGGCSYRPIQASALGDWMHDADPDSKVFSIGGKDRAAVLLGGRSADGVYWFSHETGEFVTSTYYEPVRPDWVDAFNARDLPGAFANVEWQRVLNDTTLYRERARADRFAGEGDFSSSCADHPRNDPVFDHHIRCDPVSDLESFAGLLYRTPFIDDVLLEFATTIIRSQELGADDSPDLLCIGLSGLDGVSHLTGPYSQESIDTVLRLDRELGEFLDRLDREIGEENYTVILSSDHGFAPLPEYGAVVGVPGARVGDASNAFRDAVEAELEALAGAPLVVHTQRNGFFLDVDVMRRAGVRERDAVARVAALAADEEWIAWVMGREELYALDPADPTLDPIIRRNIHHLHPSRSPNVIVCLSPGMFLSGWDRGTTHGSPYDYDTHVPLLFFGAGVGHSAAVSRFSRTVDVAPTVAAALGIPVPTPVDGRVLPEALSEQPSNEPR